MSAAVLITGLILWAAFLYFIFSRAPMDSREASDRLREKRPRYVPEEVTRSFREPFDQHAVPESGLTARELDEWPVEEPQR